MDPAKIAAMKQWQPPSGTAAQCRTQLRSFLGSANYYRKFIRNFATIAAPLYALTKEPQTRAEAKLWHWTPEAQTAFEQLKEALTSAPVLLKLPDFSRPFKVYTDASDFATGAVLAQDDPVTKFEHPVAYYSHKYANGGEGPPRGAGGGQELRAPLTRSEECSQPLPTNLTSPA